MNYNSLKLKDELLYELIFSDKENYNIDISYYVDDMYKYDDLINEIRSILKKSNVKIVKDKIDINSKTANWYLKINK